MVSGPATVESWGKNAAQAMLVVWTFMRERELNIVLSRNIFQESSQSLNAEVSNFSFSADKIDTLLIIFIATLGLTIASLRP